MLFTTTTDFDRKSRRSQLLHDFVFTSDRIFRQVDRLATAYDHVTTHGCAKCRRWLRLRRARSVALLVATLLLLIAVPRTLPSLHKKAW
ncbi:hypothetical protein GS982_31230 [Rhodococcus hoagii]|nr:hypothetical protein [Prescottella equi]